MANGTQGHLSTPRARNGEPQPAMPPAASEPASTKRDLTSWWKQFSKRGAVKKEEEKEPELPKGIFGVPLITSIPYANVAISLFNETGESYIYGYVPIVVAKCGVFLKEKATDVEGIFRLAGSEKRIKELKIAFDTPPRWGKGLDWTGYTVHDAANILRRYFNQLPEPIIPLQYYDPFRQPLRNHQAEAVGQIEGQAPSVGGFDPDNAVRIYQQLIKELPSLNRQLLLYILDLLAVFAAKSDVNKMTTSNLAAIFQPGILSHPQHDMSPQDYRLSQDVLIFLIDNQDHFLIGMEGTAVDEGTARHIESGPSTPQARTPTTPGRNASGLGRSASTSSSAAAESLRKFGGIRRNVSTSSRRSRHSGVVPSPTTPSFVASSGSGVHRSNTLPSKRSPALSGTRFSKEKHSDPPTPAPEDDHAQKPISTAEQPPQNLRLPSAVAPVPVPAAATPATSQTATQPAPVSPEAASKATPGQQPPVRSMLDIGPGQQPVRNTSDVGPPSQAAQQAPPAGNLEAQNRTQEERIHVTRPTPTEVPGAYPLPSPFSEEPPNASPPAAATAAQVLSPPTPQRQAHASPRLTPTRDRSEFLEGPVDSGPSVEPTPAVRTFTQILSKVSPSAEEKKDGRKPNKLQKKQRVASSTNPSAHSSTHSLTGHAAFDAPSSPMPPGGHPLPEPLPANSREILQAFSNDAVSSRNSGTTLKPSMSPSASFRSHSTATEYSEAEHKEEPPKEEKKSFWRSHKRGESKATPTASQTDLRGTIPGADASMSSFGSSSGWTGRRSLQYDSNQASEASMLYTAEQKEQDKKSPFSWFRERRQEHKDREAAKQRAKSPEPAHHHNLPAPPQEAAGGLAARPKSMEVPRTATSEGSSDVTPTGNNPGPTALTSQVPPASQTPPNPAAPASTNPVPSSNTSPPLASEQKQDAQLSTAQQGTAQPTSNPPAAAAAVPPTAAATAPEQNTASTSPPTTAAPANPT